MKDHETGCRLTATDYAVCRTLVKRLESAGSPLASPLRGKLAQATIVSDEWIEPTVATLNSRIEFRVDDAPLQTRILVGCEFQNGLVGLTLPIITPCGLALLGLRQGRTTFIDREGERRALLLNRVVYQPQAARLRRTPYAPHTTRGGTAEIIDLARIRERPTRASRRVSR